MTDLPRPNNKWLCEYCTFENWSASRKCTLCHAPKPLQYIDEERTPPEQDIYKIAPLVSQDCAVICGPSTPGGSTSPVSFPSAGGSGSGRGSPSVDNKWACQMCTFLNWPKTVKCTQCLTPRPKPVPVITTSVTQPLSINVNITETPSCTSVAGQGGPRTSPCTSPNSPEAAKALNNDKNKTVLTHNGSKMVKWTCRSCTYDNWTKAQRCIMCGVTRGRIYIDTGHASGNVSRSLDQDPRRRSPVSSQAGAKRLSPPASCATSRSLESVEIQQLGGATASVSPQQHQQQERPERHHQQYDDNRSNSRQRLRQIRNRMRETDWLWLNACQGVVEGETAAVEAFLASGEDAARQLTADECALLNRHSAFQVGYTLVHLAVRFQREDLLATLLTVTDVVAKAKKRVPSYVAPDVACDLLRDISACLRQRKGDFPCYFLTEIATFSLPADVADLPIPIKKQLFDELLDKDVQKELEEEEPIINWNMELTTRLGSRLYALWNRTAGDCLLDSVLQATWGVMDRDNTLRRALADSLSEGAIAWKESEAMQAESLHFTLDESQWQHDWAIILSLASQPGASLEQIHIFALAHILRRPIIVYGIKFVKSFRGENIGLAKFQGVYLPLLWEQSFCWKTPVTLGYTRGHFSALVGMETDEEEDLGAGAHLENNQEECQTTYLPLMDSQGKILPIHFLPASELGREDTLLREWLDCWVTDGGVLVARQHLTKRPVLVKQMLDEWLDRYRRLAAVVTSTPTCPAPAALSSDDETDDE